jgi:lipopolysaccharide/colanic/teichoic acid biosynthesis glycosyltransferase
VAARGRPLRGAGSATITREPAHTLDPVARSLGRSAVVLTPAAYYPRSHLGYDALKRLSDAVISLAGILLTLPLLVAIAVLIRLDSPGPVLFRQQRLGKDLQPFTMLKFRTMYVDREELPPELRAQNESTGPLFKMRADPRITRVGRVLRRTSLDELPQLLNILGGQMSLVGPRPPLPRELAGFDEVQRQRLRVLPGLTGLWQVSGRSNLPFEEMVRLDLRYIEQRSLLTDASIMLKTVPSVLFGRGAY